MKRTFLFLAATLPVVAVFWTLLGNSSLKNASNSGVIPVPDDKKTTQLPSQKAMSRAADAASRQSNAKTEREEREDKLTMNRLDRAESATKLKAEDFGKNGDFLLKKHEALFDSWGLSQDERRTFVSVLSEQSARLARIALDSNKAWPLAVGHMANRKSDNEHTKKQYDAMIKVEKETMVRLTELVGADRAAEFQRHRKNPEKQQDD